ncbi:hypothetical protein HDU97_005918 [Phlyctochytrium planicorne]|nr:hypothetical protein HDU97_005918 [Phlyctochytrium planicorne]
MQATDQQKQGQPITTAYPTMQAPPQNSFIPPAAYMSHDRTMFTARYAPFELRSCNSDWTCQISSYTPCQLANRSNNAGNFCTLDENLRGLVVCTALFGGLAFLSIGYIKKVGIAATRNIYYASIFLHFFTVLMAVCCLGVCGTMLNTPAFNYGSGSYAVKATSNSGFGTSGVTLVIFFISGVILVLQSRFAPTVVDPNVRAFAHSNLLNFSSQPVQPAPAPVMYGQPYGVPQQPTVVYGHYGQPGGVIVYGSQLQQQQQVATVQPHQYPPAVAQP